MMRGMGDPTATAEPAGLFRRLAALFYDALLAVALAAAVTFAMLPFTRGEALLASTQGLLARAYHGLLALVLFAYFGYMLVRSVRREIAQREELERSAAELKRSDDAKTEFMSIVSHQLRTPLNAIAGYLSLLLDGMYGQLDAQKREPVERLYRSNQRLIHLVKDLLGVSRIQMGRVELELEDVDVCRSSSFDEGFDEGATNAAAPMRLAYVDA